MGEAEVPKVGDSNNSDTRRPNPRLSDDAQRTPASNLSFKRGVDEPSSAVLPKIDIVQGSSMSVEQFSALATKLFNHLDTTKDGFLSDKELGAAVENQGFTGSQAQAVAALYQNWKEFSTLHNDQVGKEKKGISRADMTHFVQTQAKVLAHLQQVSEASSWAASPDNFKDVDKDGDGALSRKELSNALSERDPQYLDYAALKFLHDKGPMLQKMKGNGLLPDKQGVTKEDIDAYEAKLAGSDIVKAISGARYSMEQVAKSQNPEYPNTLYSEKQNSLESIHPDAIKQGAIGNCYFEAAVAAVAATSPEKIQSLIKEHHDGTFTVTFPGDKAHPIRIDRPSETEMGIYNGKGPYGIWPNVLEKAFGKYEQQGFWKTKAKTDAEGADGGGNPADALKLLTGKTADFDDLAFATQNIVYRKMSKAFRDGRAVVCGYGERPIVDKLLMKPERTSAGFVKNHAFSIIDFKPNPREIGKSMITIRNPWGVEEIGPRGTVQMPLSKFLKNFNTVVYE